MNLQGLGAPAFVAWQLTRGCNLACLHCCTDSAPGRALPGELSRDEALELARQVAAAGVPKVMLCGGEPTIVPHFLDVARTLGRAGVALKIETNGQRFGPELARRLSALPILSVQVSLDGDAEETYARMRPGGSLRAAHAACRAVVEAGLPLEVSFAPARANIREAEAVAQRAASLGAFRFNTGMLMRLGTAAKLWAGLEPGRDEYARFFRMLRRKRLEFRGRMELRFEPYSILRELRRLPASPPATLLVLPDGKVKVCAALPHLCADLRRQDLKEAWASYRRAWSRPEVLEALSAVLGRPERLAEANRWTALESDDLASVAVGGGKGALKVP